MTITEEIENQYFPEQFMAKYLADEFDDSTGPVNNFNNMFQNNFNKCTLSEQKPFVEQILQATALQPTDNSVPRLHFLTGAGGTGKTFVYNVLFFH